MDTKEALQHYIITHELPLQVLVAPYGGTLWVVGTPGIDRGETAYHLGGVRIELQRWRIHEMLVLPHILQVN